MIWNWYSLEAHYPTWSGSFWYWIRDSSLTAHIVYSFHFTFDTYSQISDAQRIYGSNSSSQPGFFCNAFSNILSFTSAKLALVLLLLTVELRPAAEFNPALAVSWKAMKSSQSLALFGS
jgi:hypothetical protein